MKIRELLETFDPLPSSSDSDERTAMSWIHLYDQGNAYISRLLQDRIVKHYVPSNPLYPQVYHMDFWSKGYGIFKNSENLKYITRVEKIRQQQQQAMQHLLNAPVTNQMNKTALQQQVDFLQTISGEYRAEAEAILESYPKGIDPEHGLMDSGYFVRGEDYKRAHKHITSRLFLVYKQDDILRYADVADKNTEVVKEVITLNDKLNTVAIQYKKVLSLLFPT